MNKKQVINPIDLNENCPGCGVALTLFNVGGYRTYCDKCVDDMPSMPGGMDENGHARRYRLIGEWPDFKWEVWQW